MPAYTPTTSYGTQLFYGSASGTVTTELTNIKTVSVPTDTYPTIDASHLASTIRTYVAGIPDGGELTFTYQWQATQANAIDALKGTTKWFKIGFPDTSGDILFSGILTKQELSFGEVDDIPEVTVNIKVTSVKTITVGT